MLTLSRLGLRRGELVGLRRADVHALPESTSLGCPVGREQVHVRRREDNANRAWAKSRRQRVVPMDRLVVQAHDQYLLERAHCQAAGDSDFLLVNLFKPPVGAPMRLGAVNELLATLSRRAALPNVVRPHMLRHTCATQWLENGLDIRYVQKLLGHHSISTTEIYTHVSDQSLREALLRANGGRQR